jgi:hypothetical protein
MRKFKKIILLSVVFVASQAFSKTQNPLTDVNYQFDPIKLQEAQDSFHFLRTYVDYFYLLIKKNQSNLNTVSSLMKYSGLCVGDAHAENFGFLLQNDLEPLFTVNDVDDFGPCPVVLDIFRFMVSSKIDDSTLSIKKILENYQSGLQDDKQPLPEVLKKMKKKAEEDGMSPSSSKIKNQQFIREPGIIEINSETQNLIFAKIQDSLQMNLTILDLVETVKKGGGSGGLQRYEILALNKSRELIHLELKEEITPAIYPVATAPIPDVRTKIMQALAIEQGPNSSPYYGVIELNTRSFLIRPRFSGNQGVTLSDQKNISETRDIMMYEAYRLGQIHSQSLTDKPSHYLKALSDIKIQDLETEVNWFVDFYNSQFKKISKTKAEK